MGGGRPAGGDGLSHPGGGRHGADGSRLPTHRGHDVRRRRIRRRLRCGTGRRRPSARAQREPRDHSRAQITRIRTGPGSSRAGADGSGMSGCQLRPHDPFSASS